MQVQRIQPNSSQHKQHRQNCSQLDVLEMLASVLITIGKSEQILQCMREVLVSDPTYAPLVLFKYIAGNSSQITRKNIITFLDENNLVTNEKQVDEMVKKIFQRYGINTTHGINYTSFLSFIYPYNSGILRDLLNYKIKKYPELQKVHKNLRPSQSVTTAFLLILQQEIKVQKKIQVQINDSRFPGKDKLRKIIKTVKKVSQKATTSVAQKSQSHISMYEIRNFIRAFIQVDDHVFLDIGRRLGVNRGGLVTLQSIQNTLRKIKKISCDKENVCDYQENVSKKYSNMGDEQHKSIRKYDTKYAKQLSFKEQLYKQLSSTLKITSNNKSRTPRAKSSNRENNQNMQGKNRTPSKRVGANLNTDLSGLDSSLYFNDNFSNFKNEKVLKQSIGKKEARIDRNFTHSQKIESNLLNRPKQKLRENNHNLSITILFKQFIETFLRSHKQIQRCKSKLCKFNIDYLSLFKTLDNGRGMVDQQSMKRLYTKLSGVPIDYDFQLLIDKFAQPLEKWLSFSQFSDMFRTPGVRSEQNNEYQNHQSPSLHQVNGVRMHSEATRLMAQIIFLTLDLQFSLKKIIQKMKTPEIEWLFTQINIDSESKGFINYQQLKKYLTETLNMSITMVDLMAVLKRLDKGKNGVVVREQFLTT